MFRNNFVRKKIAIIGAIGRASVYAKNAREIGVETHCFDWNTDAAAKNEVDYFHQISVLDKEAVLNRCQEIGIDGVVSTTELAMETTAYVAEKMGLNGNQVDIARVIMDKYRNRNVTQNVVGLYHPKYIETNSLDEIKNSFLSYPIILKPTNKAGKKGIYVSYSKEETERAFDYTIQECGKDTHFIVEEFIEGGAEYSVESLSYHGKHYIIQITEKITSGPPHCVELGHKQPANITDEIRCLVSKTIKEALSAIGLSEGPCHTEIKIKNGRIYLIEFNARTGGDNIAYPLTNLSTGYEYIKGCIRVALDEDPEVDEAKFEHNYAGVLFVTEQTKHLLPLFSVCENYAWCYEKKLVQRELQSMTHNDALHTNYFIYYSKDGHPDFDEILKTLDR